MLNPTSRICIVLLVQRVCLCFDFISACVFLTRAAYCVHFCVPTLCLCLRDTIVSQLHQPPGHLAASPNQSPARVITGIFDPLELTRTLGTLAVNEITT